MLEQPLRLGKASTPRQKCLAKDDPNYYYPYTLKVVETCLTDDSPKMVNFSSSPKILLKIDW